MSQRKLLDPSELGTKDYWDSIYRREYDNHEEDQEDEGTIWFDESNAEEAILRKLDEFAQKGLLRRSPPSDEHVGDGEDSTPGDVAARFLDLGTGNGHMLFALREEDDDGLNWCGEMVGVDYSESSVRLARRIAAQRDGVLQSSSSSLLFATWDLLQEMPGLWLGSGFEVVLDKGTFDAISLMPYEGGSLHPCELYRQKVEPLIKPGHFLFVTSCNWTRNELVEWLVSGGSELEVFEEVKYPTFTFGGQTGQSIVTVVFRRRTP